MSAIALQTQANEHLGFLLLAGDGSVLTEGGQVDCVLTGVPMDVALLDAPLGKIIQSRKNTEFTVVVDRSPTHTALAIDLGDGWHLALALREDGIGTWSASHESGQRFEGNCELASRDRG